MLFKKRASALMLILLPLALGSAAHAAPPKPFQPPPPPVAGDVDPHYLYVVTFQVERRNASGNYLPLWSGVATANEGTYRDHIELPYRHNVDMDAGGMITGFESGKIDEGVEVTFKVKPGSGDHVELSATGAMTYPTDIDGQFKVRVSPVLRLQSMATTDAGIEFTSSPDLKLGETEVFPVTDDVRLRARVERQ